MGRQSTAKQQTARRHAKATTGPQGIPDSTKSAASNLDRLIHERLRLGIISALAANESLTFSDLKSLMNTTDGNLSVHARKLEDAGYIAVTKYFEGRLPKTEYKLTAAGRRALENYLSHMETLIQQMRT
ncbi:MAG TPA: transcriptional regulator [Pyrinomonadaceae bacterium]|nr:transcriptional regulator [Pyrinomonadaceae bacterium]